MFVGELDMNFIEKIKMRAKTKKMKLIYKAIDYSFIKEEYIKNTYNSRWKRDSENSFMFSIKKEKDKPATNEDKLTIIENIFEIKDNSYVRDKYNQAINGSGKEEKRISVLHSSSLTAKQRVRGRPAARLGSCLVPGEYYQFQLVLQVFLFCISSPTIV